MLFEDLHLIEPLVRAVRAAGYQRPSPIQQQAIPHILGERDLIGCARTGTGKTAAFVLPILQLLERDRAAAAANRRGRHLRVLVLSPTRELAAQIGDSFAQYGKFLDFRHSVIFGGVGQQPQVDLLRRGVDIVVATPGRLLDLMSQGHVHLDRLETFVLDEADRMLDMGFIHDVKKVVAKLPDQRHTLLFSATMPEPIRTLADRILHQAVRVDVTPTGTTAERIDQSVYHVAQSSKRLLLVQVLKDPVIERVLVFTRTKHGANRLVEHLAKAQVNAQAIHGNKSQSARERALAGFKSGATRVLVATDIAARGIDIDGITHVINFDLPEVAESYVHRIGRTARAGATGIALSFCDPEEMDYLRAIERLTRERLREVAGHGFTGNQPAEPRHEPQHARPPMGRSPQHARSPQPQRASRPAQPRVADGDQAQPARHDGVAHAPGRHDRPRRRRW